MNLSKRSNGSLAQTQKFGHAGGRVGHAGLSKQGSIETNSDQLTIAMRYKHSYVQEENSNDI